MLDDGSDGAVIGHAATVTEAHDVGKSKCSDPDYPWYRIDRNGKMVSRVNAMPGGEWDPDAGVYVHFRPPFIDDEHLAEMFTAAEIARMKPMPLRSEWPRGVE